MWSKLYSRYWIPAKAFIHERNDRNAILIAYLESDYSFRLYPKTEQFSLLRFVPWKTESDQKIMKLFFKDLTLLIAFAEKLNMLMGNKSLIPKLL